LVIMLRLNCYIMRNATFDLKIGSYSNFRGSLSAS
jgi:hypothetical protein